MVRAMYKVRCSKCKKYKLRTEMIFLYSHCFCHDCNCNRKVSNILNVNIPINLMRAVGLIPGDFIVIKKDNDVFFIEKNDLSCNKRKISKFNQISLSKVIVGDIINAYDNLFFWVEDKKIFFRKQGDYK